MQRATTQVGSVTPAELRRGGWDVPPILAKETSSLAWLNTLDMPAIVELYRTPQAFFETCQGVHLDSSVGYFSATPTQLRFLDHVHRYRWTNAKKGRQAMITTAYGLGVLLRDCQYLTGLQGVLIADTRETAEMVFERLVFAYERQDPMVKMPLARGDRPAVRHMKFIHGGGISVLTMGSKAPAVGRSIDRLHITEFGEAQWQEQAAVSMFPTVAKRPSVRVVLEGTPGRSGSYDHAMWLRALGGKGRFAPLFLYWFDEAANAVDLWGDPRKKVEAIAARHEGDLREWLARAMDLGDPSAFGQDELAEAVCRATFESLPEPVLRDVFLDVLTDEERRYFDDTGRATLRHAAYRRDALDTEFAGDGRLFSAKFPKNSLDGWIGSLRPVMPVDALAAMIPGALPDGAFPVGDSACFEVEPPASGASYVITADPAHYGSTGDPSALTVWRVLPDSGMRLAAFWQGREDPGRFASRIVTAQTRYTTRLAQGDPTVIAVESNAMGAVQSLVDRGIDGLFWCEREKPGWFATEPRVQRAEARAVDMLRQGKVEIRAASVLTQIADYDGSQRTKRSRGPGGLRHHFDLARCFLIAADIVAGSWFPDDAAATEEAPGDESQRPGRRPGVTWADMDADRKQRQSARRIQVLGPGDWDIPAEALEG